MAGEYRYPVSTNANVAMVSAAQSLTFSLVFGISSTPLLQPLTSFGRRTITLELSILVYVAWDKMPDSEKRCRQGRPKVGTRPSQNPCRCLPPLAPAGELEPETILRYSKLLTFILTDKDRMCYM